MSAITSLRISLFVIAATLAASPAVVDSAEPRTFRDVEYAMVDENSLRLDIYLPEPAATKAAKPKLVVWVHGGAWRAGSKSDVPHEKFTALGFAVASVDYRLSPVAQFPAQIHDIKGAIRFLRAKADVFGFDASSIVVAGSSAGGHLAALVGVSNGVQDLEGTTGGNRERKSDVQAIVSYYGASNLMTILAQSKPRGLEMRPPALQLLLGGQPTDVPELAKLASPVRHVDAKDPPMLLIHGDADQQMPPDQSTELAEAYRKAGLTVTLEMIPGAAHGGPEFFDEKRIALLQKFLTDSVGK